MSSSTTIRELMHDADNLIGADELVRNARPQFELETARSLILIDETGPVGLLTRRRMREISDAQMSMPVRDFMVPVPTVQQSQTLADARRDLAALEFDADRLPVLNDEGRFVGVVNRDAILREAESLRSDQGMVQINGDASRNVPIHSGMEVHGAGDEKLGKIDEIVIERDRVASFTIQHGLLGRRHKRVAAEHITSVNVDEDTVYLNFGKTEFGLLADTSDIEEDQIATH